MNINDAFPGKYLKASDLQGHNVPVVIDRIEKEDIGEEEKVIVYFRGKAKGLVLNKTNAGNIQALYGDETDDWVGQPLILYSVMTEFKGKSLEGLRVRGPQPKDRPQSKKTFPPDRIETGPQPTRQPVARPSLKDELEDEIPEF